MKKVLFTATVDSHILQFHLPFLKLFKENGYEVHVATNGTEEIPYCDVKHVVSFERSPIKINNLKAIKQLKKICNEEKFDIIHCHTPMGSVVTRLAARKSRKKYHTRVIYTAHGFHFYKGAPLKNWLIFYPVEKWLAKYTDTLITINQEDYDLAKSKFSKRCYDIQYVPGVGIDEEKFSFKMSNNEKHELRESLGLKDNDFVMIYPAELSKRKRQIWLINSISSLLKEHSDIHLLLPGKDSLNGKCQTLVKELGLENQIHFLGYRKDIPKLLKISNLALSSANQEGLPVNVMEAMYVGLPIVASDCRGNRDLVKNGKNGYLVKIDDMLLFKNSIKSLYTEVTSEYVKNNKSLICDFMLEKVSIQMKAIYKIECKKNNSLISIVVPVYNVEDYLERCVNSLIDQTYKNIEIILIDDGSTDNSSRICDILKKSDSRIIVLHKKNGGLSSARNEGIARASGDFISFVDSDDYVSEDYVETLYNLIIKNNSDISVCIWKEAYDDGTFKSIYRVKKYIELSNNNYIMLEHMLYQKLFDTSACAKLYKLSLFDNIRYPVGMLYEDLATTYKLFLKAKSISYSNKEIYYYYRRKNSITLSSFKEKDMDLISISKKLLLDLEKIDKENNLNNSLKNAAVQRFLSSNFSILKKTKMKNIYKKYNNICINNIIEYKRISFKYRFKTNIAVLVFKIIFFYKKGNKKVG